MVEDCLNTLPKYLNQSYLLIETSQTSILMILDYLLLRDDKKSIHKILDLIRFGDSRPDLKLSNTSSSTFDSTSRLYYQVQHMLASHIEDNKNADFAKKIDHCLPTGLNDAAAAKIIQDLESSRRRRKVIISNLETLLINYGKPIKKETEVQTGEAE